MYEYVNCGGVKDNIKIEINYMLRCHVLPVAKREVKLPWNERKLTVLSVAPLEIFASNLKNIGHFETWSKLQKHSIFLFSSHQM